MSRYSRINTIWQKELIDTLRDRRTVIAMVLVPMVLYPALMLGSIQAFEVQTSRLKEEVYRVAVESERVRTWLSSVIDTDRTRREVLPASNPAAAGAEEPAPDGKKHASVEKARTDLVHQPPPLEILVVNDASAAVRGGLANVGLLADSLPTAQGDSSAPLHVVYDEADVRSKLAAAALEGIFDRLSRQIVAERLESAHLTEHFVRPIDLQDQNIATPEKMGGSILGQIVPLILVIMTITGAIYPAIDLTAGERERGTLETLMAAPVPTVDLIAGKFVVVALIGMISATLNLLSIGGTIYLGGFGSLLSGGNDVQIPLRTLPLVLIVLVPLAVMFSAMLLAVSSFARSFKEAQNYVMPVMMAALIPAVVGILPGTRLEGPMLIMPVANIVILTRDLFSGIIDPAALAWVWLTTSVYAAAAVAVAAKLFGQEAVLFADSASVKTIFQRRFFKPASRPTAAQALLLTALVFSLNFFAQQALLHNSALRGGIQFFQAVSAVLIMFFLVLPIAACLYMRVDIAAALRLRAPRPLPLLAAVLLGASTWILGSAWLAFQQRHFPMMREMIQQFEQIEGWLGGAPLWMAVMLLAVIPPICEELFFRGYVLSGLQRTLGLAGAVAVSALAFAMNHHSAHRFVLTAALGIMLGLLAARGGSIIPPMIAHIGHNAISFLASRENGLKPLLARLGYAPAEFEYPPLPWVLGAALLTLAAIGLCLATRPPRADCAPHETAEWPPPDRSAAGQRAGVRNTSAPLV